MTLALMLAQVLHSPKTMVAPMVDQVPLLALAASLLRADRASWHGGYSLNGTGLTCATLQCSMLLFSTLTLAIAKLSKLATLTGL